MITVQMRQKNFVDLSFVEGRLNQLAGSPFPAIEEENAVIVIESEAGRVSFECCTRT